MLQEIYPKKFNNVYDADAEITDEDYVLIFAGRDVVFKNENYDVLKYRDIKHKIRDSKTQYLFSIDKDRFFWVDNVDADEYTVRKKIIDMRYHEPQWYGYAAACGEALKNWYKSSKFCGVCGGKTVHSTTERAMVCSECGHTIYPRICPAVIAAVTDGDKILLIKYAYGPYKKYALVAGYNEIGETPEETVKREVMEETGLEVDNLKYFGSQPWPFSGSMLLGYFCELAGENKIRIDKKELSEARWMDRAELEEDKIAESLTKTMIETFRKYGNDWDVH